MNASVSNTVFFFFFFFFYRFLDVLSLWIFFFSFSFTLSLFFSLISLFLLVHSSPSFSIPDIKWSRTLLNAYVVCFSDVNHVPTKRENETNKKNKREIFDSRRFIFSPFFSNVYFTRGSYIGFPLKIKLKITHWTKPLLELVKLIVVRPQSISQWRFHTHWTFEVQLKTNTKWNANNYKIETKHAFPFISILIISISANHRHWLAGFENVTAFSRQPSSWKTSEQWTRMSLTKTQREMVSNMV